MRGISLQHLLNHVFVSLLGAPRYGGRGHRGHQSYHSTLIETRLSQEHDNSPRVTFAGL